jgi:4-carboxymuconolactone decarboxylase
MNKSLLREEKRMGVRGFDEGLAIRRAVLGDEYVDRALASADAFSKPFQEFVTAYCWGGPWTRPALDRKTRSMITLGILTALSKPKEIEAHVRGALNNGCTPDEIREVLMHATVYCGVPAGVEAVRAAQPVMASQAGGDGATNDG